MKSRISMVTLLVAFNILHCYGQGTDSKGKDLFVLKNVPGVSFPLTSSSFSFNYTNLMSEGDSTNNARKEKTHLYSYYFPELEHHYSIMDQGGDQGAEGSDPQLPDTMYNVTDVGRGWTPYFINIKVSNIVYKTAADFFSSKNQPTIQVELGGIYNSVLNFNNWSRLQKTNGFGPFKEFDAFWSIYANVNCINYLDTVSGTATSFKKQSLENVLQYGGKANFTAYSRWFAVAITANINHGMLVDLLGSYQSGQSKPVYSGDTTYYNQGTSDGKYGGAIADERKIYSSRFSVAVPIFLGALAGSDMNKINNKMISHLYIMPYYVLQGPVKAKWTQQAGVTLNVLSNGYGGYNSKIVQSGGFGFDIFEDDKSSTGWGSPQFYITGTINLAGLGKLRGNSKPSGSHSN